MKRKIRAFVAAGGLLIPLFVADPVIAQKQGGILKMYDPDSPASMSIHEEATIVSERPMMGVFNNLVMFDQHVKQNSLQSIVPDLATGWSWNEDGTELTFPLHQGVTWHDGKPFTAKDVQCTWDHVDGQDEREASRQSPQVLVSEPGGSYHQRRLRGHVSSHSAAAGLSHAARFRIFPDLSLSCSAARHAPASDRHGPI